MTFIKSLKHTEVPGLIPNTTQLAYGEILVSTTDGLLYFIQNSSNTSVLVALGPTPISANSLTNSVTISLSGDVNGNVSFNGSSNVTLSTLLSNVTTAGTYASVVVNAKGLVVSGTNTVTSNLVVQVNQSIVDISAGVPAYSVFTSNTIVGNVANVIEYPSKAIVLNFPPSSNSATTLTKSSPTAPYRIAVLWQALIVNDNSQYGVMFNDGTKSLGIMLSFSNSALTWVTNKYSTKFSGVTPISSEQISVIQNIWLGLRDDGNSVYLETSADGVSFTTRYTEVKSTGYLSNYGNVVTVANQLDSTDNTIFTLRCWDENGLNRTFANTSVVPIPITLSGDVIGNSYTTSIYTQIANSGVVAGTYNKVIVNAKGIVTNSANLVSNDITTALGFSPISNIANVVISGDVSGSGIYSNISVFLSNVVTAGTYASVIINSKGLVINGTNVVYSGDVSGVSNGNNTVLTLANIVTPGTYNYIVVNSKGQITNGVNIPGGNGTTFANVVYSGDVFGTSNGTNAILTISNVVSSGTYTKVIVNAKGQVTNSANLISNDITTALGYTPINPNGISFVITGDISGSANSNASNISVVSTLASITTSGTYNNITIDSTGRVTSARALNNIDIFASLGYVPLSNANYFFIYGDVSGYGIGTNIIVSLSNSVVSPGTYYSVIVNSKGLVTGGNTVAPILGNGVSVTTYSGDVFGISNGSNVILTLANVVSSGTYTKVIVNAKGQVTNSANLVSSDIITALGYTPVNKAGDTVSGNITFNGNTLFNNITAFNNNTSLAFAGTNNNYIQIYVDSSNNLNLIGTNGSGGYRTIFQMAQESNTSALVFSVPVQMGSGATAVTVANTDNTTNIATTAFVKNQNYLTTITLSGDISGTGTNSITTTLATVNSNVGTFNNLVINAKGLVTSARVFNSSDITTALGYTPLNKAGDTVTGAFIANSSLTVNGTTTFNSNITIAGNNTKLIIPGAAGYPKYFYVDYSGNLHIQDSSNVDIFFVPDSGAITIYPGLNILGVATAVTVANTDNTTNIATTAFVKNQGYLTTNQNITLSGDISGIGTNAITTTLVNVGTIGTYVSVTTDAKGRVVSGSNSVSYNQLPTEVLNFPLIFSLSGSIAANATIGIIIIQNTTLLANFVSSQGYAMTAPTSNSIFTVSYIRSNTTTSIGNVSFASNSHTATFSTSNSVSLIPGDFIYVKAPGIADATLSTVGITFMGQKV